MTTTSEPAWTPPAVIPEGWIHDFDYASSMTKYLRQQFDSARLEGAFAYVYVYSDSSNHCRATRKLMRKPVVAAALRDVRITMLNYDRLMWLHTRTNGVAFNPGKLVPFMAKISIDGVFTDSLMYPDTFLFHPDFIGFPKTRLPTTLRRMTPALFAEELHKYFDAHNEI